MNLLTLVKKSCPTGEPVKSGIGGYQRSMALSKDKYVLSIDPGKSSGIALGHYTETQPYHLLRAWQFSGGAMGIIDWIKHKHISRSMTIISEKFTPRPNGKFGLTLGSVESLVGEGVLLAFDLMPPYTPSESRWQQPQMQYFVGGKDKTEKRKRLKKFLKDTDNYVFGKELGQPDNEDAVSAIAHGIAYVMKVELNRPTHSMVADWKGPK